MKLKAGILFTALTILFFGCNSPIDVELENINNDGEAIQNQIPSGTPTLLYVDIEEQTINRINLDDFVAEVLFEIPNGPSGVLAYDPTDQYIYYTDYFNERILRNTLDGSDEQVVIENAPDVRAMVLDPVERKLYYSSYSTFVINSYDIEESQKSIAVEGPNFRSYGNLQDMELVGNQFYSITPVQNKESVFRATVNSKTTRQVLNYEEAGYGYGIGVDEVNGYIYFNNVEEAAIMRSTLDGENIEKVVSLDKVRVYGIVADGLEGKLYWTTWGNEFGISDLDGKNRQVFNLKGANRNLIKIYWPD